MTTATDQAADCRHSVYQPCGSAACHRAYLDASAARGRDQAMPGGRQLEHLAAEAARAFADRAEFARADWRAWSDITTWRRYVTMLESGRAWACPRTGRVVASVADDGWSYIAAEILDTAFDRAGMWQHGTWDNARIDTYPGVAVLRFT